MPFWGMVLGYFRCNLLFFVFLFLQTKTLRLAMGSFAHFIFLSILIGGQQEVENFSFTFYF